MPEGTIHTYIHQRRSYKVTRLNKYKYVKAHQASWGSNKARFKHKAQVEGYNIQEGEVQHIVFTSNGIKDQGCHTREGFAGVISSGRGQGRPARQGQAKQGHKTIRLAKPRPYK